MPAQKRPQEKDAPVSVDAKRAKGIDGQPVKGKKTGIDTKTKANAKKNPKDTQGKGAASADDKKKGRNPTGVKTTIKATKTKTKPKKTGATSKAGDKPEAKPKVPKERKKPAPKQAKSRGIKRPSKKDPSKKKPKKPTKAKPLPPVFNFTLLVSTGQLDNHYVLLKQLRPTLELTYNAACANCIEAAAFFKSMPIDYVPNPYHEDHTQQIQHDEEEARAKMEEKETAATDEGEKKPPAKKKRVRQPACRLECVYIHPAGRKGRGHRSPVWLPNVHRRFTDTKHVSTKAVESRLKKIFYARQPPPLRPHQLDALEHMSFDPTTWHRQARLLDWAMGSGKSRAMAEILLRSRSAHTVVICNNSLIEYMYKTIDVLPVLPLGATSLRDKVDPRRENKPMLVEIVGYAEFHASDRILDGVEMAIVDEAHNYKNITKPGAQDVKKLHCANMLLLLTGTPIVNDSTDINGLAYMMDKTGHGTDVRSGGICLTSEAKEADIKAACHAFASAYQNCVSFYNPKVHQPEEYALNYPSSSETVIGVPMSWPQTLVYLLSRENVFRLSPKTNGSFTKFRNRYHCATRAACMGYSNPKGKMHSTKLNTIVDHVVEHKLYPCTIHITLIKNGVDPFMEMLGERLEGSGYRIACITGETPNGERDAIRDCYNCGKLDILIITRASSNGLDLMQTKAMYLASTHNNLQEENQTRMRVARMYSHAKCDYKTVQYFKYIATFPPLSLPISREEMDECCELLNIHYIDTGTLSRKEVEEALKTHVATETKGTIEEIIDRDNVRKMKDIQPLLRTVEGCSIVMPHVEEARRANHTQGMVQEEVFDIERSDSEDDEV